MANEGVELNAERFEDLVGRITDRWLKAVEPVYATKLERPFTMLLVSRKVLVVVCSLRRMLACGEPAPVGLGWGC